MATIERVSDTQTIEVKVRECGRCGEITETDLPYCNNCYDFLRDDI